MPDDVWQRSELISFELVIDKSQTQLVSFSRSKYITDSLVVLLATQPSWVELTAPIIKPSLALIFLLILFSILIAYQISGSLAKPIELLSERTSKVGKGDWSKIEMGQTGVEIYKLTNAFNTMIENLKSREQELKIAQTKIVQTESLAAVGRMGAGIAHEVKNPLSSILGYGQLIEMKISSSQDASAAPQLLIKIQEYVKLLLDDTRRANRIISDLLTFSRQNKLQTERINLFSMLLGFEPKLKALCESKNIVFINETLSQPEQVFINIDADQIYQVVFNLVQNASHALDKAHHHDKIISLNTAVLSDFVEITVADNGPGISPENIKMIFEPFFTTKKVGEGTGLGLALSYGIVQQHSGSIDVTSAPGVLTRFKIKLPRAD